jgi:uncharacterized spore protein YtfJ
MENAQKFLESMYDKLDEFLKTETVVGEPIIVDNIKLIPIITASFGLGGGFGEANNTESGGGGGGLGCRISPDAILVVKDGEVELIPIKKKASLEKLIEKAPELLSKVEEMTSKKEKEEKDEKTERDERAKEY